jgi:hypothetical protein
MNISDDVKIYLCSYLCNNDKLSFLLTSKYNNNLKNIYFDKLIYEYKINNPYVLKLFLQELLSMSIDPDIKIKKHKY